MNTLFRAALGAAFLCAAITTGTYAQEKSAGYAEFGRFEPSVTKGQFVEINIRANLISMAAKLAEKQEPEIAELLRGLQLVRVNVISLTEENRAEIKERVMAIRGELDAAGWEPVVTVRAENEDVGIYIKTRGEEAVEGIVVTVLASKGEAVLVNIVGNINPEKIGVISERFNLPPLAQAASFLKKE
jgi:hypothetical protein